MSKRIQRVNQLIKRELSQILLKEVEFPRGILMTITRVENNPDLRESKVYISCLPENQILKVLQILNQKIYDIQQILNKRLKIRPTPRIKFVEEKETSEAGRIEELLEEIKRNKKR
jgi:ribosome-binding factor A